MKNGDKNKSVTFIILFSVDCKLFVVLRHCSNLGINFLKSFNQCYFSKMYILL